MWIADAVIEVWVEKFLRKCTLEFTNQLPKQNLTNGQFKCLNLIHKNNPPLDWNLVYVFTSRLRQLEFLIALCKSHSTCCWWRSLTRRRPHRQNFIKIIMHQFYIFTQTPTPKCDIYRFRSPQSTFLYVPWSRTLILNSTVFGFQHTVFHLEAIADQGNGH